LRELCVAGRGWLTPASSRTLVLAWVAFKVGALSYGGGFVIIPLMQQRRRRLRHRAGKRHGKRTPTIGALAAHVLRCRDVRESKDRRANPGSVVTNGEE
jgi:hypothetical protein